MTELERFLRTVGCDIRLMTNGNTIGLDIINSNNDDLIDSFIGDSIEDVVKQLVTTWKMKGKGIDD